MGSKFDIQYSCHSLIQVLFLVSSIHYTNGQFIISPMSQTVSLREEATFQCSHSEADYYRWRVNGTLVSNSRPPMGIRLGSRGGNPHPVQVLIITGSEDYNETEIVCIARFDDERRMDHASLPAYLHVLATSVTISVVSPIFTKLPTNKVVPEMTVAIFECQLRSAIISWNFNGTSLNDFNPRNLTSTNIPVADGTRVDLLIVLGRPEYNGTTIGCIGSYLDDREPQYSPLVHLLIQGPLSGVTSIKRHVIGANISWTAPFSLNLTDADPDIIYCLEVINKTCRNRDSLISICNLRSSYYVDQAVLNKADIFEISVTPKSNVMGALSGSKLTIQEQYIYFNESVISPIVRKTSPVTVEVEVHLRTNFLNNGVAPDSYIVSLESINGTTFKNFTSTSIIVTESLVILHVPGVPYGDLWNCTLYVTRCGGITVSDITALSTFDIQNIELVTNNFSTILVNCILIDGSQAAGILVIAYSVLESDVTDIHYEVASRNDQKEIQAVLSCLPAQSYNVLLYVIDETGLPLDKPASFPLTGDVNTSNSDTNIIQCTERKPPIKYTIFIQEDAVCVKCNVICIAIVHQNISQLNVTNGFLNISSITLIDNINKNETSLKYFKCIQGINLLDYQIGVIPLIRQTDREQEPNDNEGSRYFPIESIILAIAITTGIFIIIILQFACALCHHIFISRKKAIYDMASKTEQVSSQGQEHTMSDNAGHLAYHETDNCSTTSAPADLMQLQISEEIVESQCHHDSCDEEQGESENVADSLPVADSANMDPPQLAAISRSTSHIASEGNNNTSSLQNTRHGSATSGLYYDSGLDTPSSFGTPARSSRKTGKILRRVLDPLSFSMTFMRRGHDSGLHTPSSLNFGGTPSNGRSIDNIIESSPQTDETTCNEQLFENINNKEPTNN